MTIELMALLLITAGHAVAFGVYMGKLNARITYINHMFTYIKRDIDDIKMCLDKIRGC